MNLENYQNKLPYPEPRRSKEGQEQQQAYWEEAARLKKQFEIDLATEYGLLEHSKRYLLFYKAWSEGHSDGLHSVKQWYDNLYELIS